MKKHLILIGLITGFLLTGCATKSYVQMETERYMQESAKADSTMLVELRREQQRQSREQDSLYAALQQENNSLFLDLMDELYQKNYDISALQERIDKQARYIDSLTADVDTLQRLQTRFKDADYSIFDLSTVKTTLDSLIINQKHLSRELQYMIRDLNLIERNLMDIMNYSLNTHKNQLLASDMKVRQDLYKNNATAYKMIMLYLMNNSSSDPENLLEYIDSVYAMGDALDTVNVHFGPSQPALEDTTQSIDN
jgi:hypothetical protein